MGFNPRLAPYTVTYQQDNVFEVTSATVDIDWFRFPFAGQLLAVYAAVSGDIQTDTSTALTTLAIGKSEGGSTAYAAAASRVVVAGSTGSTWDETTQYTLTNSSTDSEVKFAQGDWAMIRRIMVHSTGGLRGMNVQMDYVIGYAV